MAKEYAPGIARKDFFGDETKLKVKEIYDFVVQKHHARKAGLHYDFRIGNKNTGMFSWVLKNGLPKADNAMVPAIRTNLHSHRYNQFEGEIPSGYGAGTVSKHDEGKVLITRMTPNTISFSIAQTKYPERYTLVKPKLGGNVWLLVKSGTPNSTGSEKQHLKVVREDKLPEVLRNLPEGHVVQPKLDGALNFLNFINGKAEMLSHRYSKVTGKPVVQTERFFGEIPHIDLPPELRDAVLHAEVYGTKDSKPITQQETSGILNSSLSKAISDMKERGVDLKGMLFHIERKGKNPLGWDTPYEERKAAIKEYLKYLPEGKFHLPEEAKTSDDALKLFNDIKNKTHGHTEEGVVIYPPTGAPSKHKVSPEQDVFIRKFFPGEGKYKGIGVGGFEYSHTPDGKIVGRVGTGISDELRKMMHQNPDWFVDRVAKVTSLGEQPSGALRMPVFHGIHEDYPSPLTGPGAEWMKKNIKLHSKQVK